MPIPGQIWLLDEDESLRAIATLTGVERLLFSDDATRLAYMRTVDEYRVELGVIYTETSTARVVVDADTFDAIGAELPRDEFGPLAVLPSGLAFVPGTHTLAFRADPLYNALGGAVLNDLWLFDADGDHLAQVLLRVRAVRFNSRRMAGSSRLSTLEHYVFMGSTGRCCTILSRIS